MYLLYQDCWQEILMIPLSPLEIRHQEQYAILVAEYCIIGAVAVGVTLAMFDVYEDFKVTTTTNKQLQ